MTRAHDVRVAGFDCVELDGGEDVGTASGG